MVRERLQKQSLPPGWVPPYEQELAAEQQQQASPERSIYDRFEAARELLLLRGVRFTSEQEAAFKDKCFELSEIYEAEHPGKTAPALRYDANGTLQFVWPSGWHQEMREARV